MRKTTRYPHEKRVKRVFRHTRPKGTIAPEKRLPDVTYAESKDFCKMQEVFSPRLLKYYRLKTKYKGRFTVGRFKRIISMFLRYMGRHMTDNRSGVFIKNFGYFFISRRPTRRVIRYVIGGIPVYSTQIMNLGSHYLPAFIPIRKDGLMHQWSMDRAFDQKLCNRIKRYTKAKRVTYKCALSVLISFYGRKDLNYKTYRKKEDVNNN